MDLVLLQSSRYPLKPTESLENNPTIIKENEIRFLSTSYCNKSSRFAARIIMEKTGLQRSYIFAGAFDHKYEINIGVS